MSLLSGTGYRHRHLRLQCVLCTQCAAGAIERLHAPQSRTYSVTPHDQTSAFFPS